MTQWPYPWRNGSDKFLQQSRRDLQRDDDTLWRILANRKYRPCTPVLVLGSRLLEKRTFPKGVGVCRYQSASASISRLHYPAGIHRGARIYLGRDIARVRIRYYSTKALKSWEERPKVAEEVPLALGQSIRDEQAFPWFVSPAVRVPWIDLSWVSLLDTPA